MPDTDLTPDADGRIAPSAERVRRLVAAQFPHYAHLPVTPVARSGWDNRTFHLGDDLSIRLPSAARYAAQVEKEHRWLPHLAAALSVPVRRGGDGAAGGGLPVPLVDLSLVAGRAGGSGPSADAAAFARDVADFLRALHGVETDGAPVSGEHNFHRGGSLAVYDGETRAALAALARRSTRAPPETLWGARSRLRVGAGAVWVHGDVSAGNLLVDEAGRLAAGDRTFWLHGVGDPGLRPRAGLDLPRRPGPRGLPHPPRALDAQTLGVRLPAAGPCGGGDHAGEGRRGPIQRRRRRRARCSPRCWAEHRRGLNPPVQPPRRAYCLSPAPSPAPCASTRRAVGRARRSKGGAGIVEQDIGRDAAELGLLAGGARSSSEVGGAGEHQDRGA